MPVYSVNYDLNKPGQDYSGLLGELRASPGYLHLLKSGWIIGTHETPDQVWERLAKHIDKGDRFLIIQVVNYRQGWLTKEQWQWIDKLFSSYG
jgi:hypothetical protein